MRVDDSSESIEARIGIFLFFFSQDERRGKRRMEFVFLLNCVAACVGTRFRTASHVRVPPREFDGLPSAGAAPALRTGTQEPEGTDRPPMYPWKTAPLDAGSKTPSRISVPRWLECVSRTSLNLPSFHTYAVKMDNRQNTSPLSIKKVSI